MYCVSVSIEVLYTMCTNGGNIGACAMYFITFVHYIPTLPTDLLVHVVVVVVVCVCVCVC